MAYKLVVLYTAKIEYCSILNYIANILQDKKAVKNFYYEFNRIISLLRNNPNLFSISQFEELSINGYHKANVNNYLILYKIEKQTIYIAHIFHQMQDYGKLV